MSCIKHHILIRIRHLLNSASPFLTAKGDEIPSKKTPLLDVCCHVSMNTLLMRYFTKKLSLQSFHRKYCTIKDGAQTLACSKKELREELIELTPFKSNLEKRKHTKPDKGIV